VEYVAFLRGINVGKNKRISMAELRDVVTSLGHTDVTTYLQSGNLVFSSSRRGNARLAGEIERAVADQLGVPARVLVLSRHELAAVVRSNPIPEATADPSRFHCVFLEKVADADRVSALEAEDFSPDEFVMGDGVMYVWYRGGVQDSKLSKVLDRRLGVACTARNWNTVTRLVDR
jgi:uncharacterized protein (DUF1697 family)